MRVRVFVQNEAGSIQKNQHDEHVPTCFRDASARIAASRFLGREAALAHIASHWEPA
jgi:hypothetical protein